MLTGIRHSCARFRRKRLSDREPGAPAHWTSGLTRLVAGQVNTATLALQVQPALAGEG
jgi:hypothetical protein